MINVKDEITKIVLTERGLTITDELVKEYKTQMWYNLRSSNATGLRLTEAGLKFVMEAKLETYEIDFPANLVLTPQILIWLDNFIKSPYYITKKQITVMTQSSAVELVLLAGDLHKYGYSKVMSQRFNK